jgi:hypothetical protein
MIEVRVLTKKELNNIITNAVDTETRNLNKIIDEPYEFFKNKAVRQEGIIINGRPIYFYALTFNKPKNRFELWTIVNSDVKEQFSLFKLAKRISQDWIKTYKEIYATMEKVNLKNIEWTKRLGFIPIQENENTITFKLGGV